MLLRWVTGLILAGLAGIALWIGLYAWGGFLGVLLAIASIEWKHLSGIRDYGLVVAIVFAFILFVFSFEFHFYLLSFLPGLLVFPMIGILSSQDSQQARALTWTMSGIIWLSLPTALLYFTRQEFGWKVVALLLLATIAQDTFALYGGMFFGGDRPFAPGISPNKTWAGGIFAVISTVAITSAGGYFLAWPIHLTVALGLLMGSFGQMGDLSISALKRQRGLKDTGNLFPGHGGILDRVDGLVMNVSVFYPFCFWMIDLS